LQDGVVTAVLDLLRTADGEVLAASLVPGAGETCFLLAHGFSGSSDKPAATRELGFELWLEPGFAHAETGASPALVDRLGVHLPALLERA